LRNIGIIALVLGIVGVTVGAVVWSTTSAPQGSASDKTALQLGGDTPATSSSKPDGVQMEFTYLAGSQYLTPAVKEALDEAAATFAANFVVASPVTLVAAVTAVNAPTDAMLAEGSSELVADSGFSPSVVQQKVLTGVDANGSAADFELQWNFAHPWALGDDVRPDQYDFQSVAMREFMHAFGFASNLGPPGTNAGNLWTIYDEFLVDGQDRAQIQPAVHSTLANLTDIESSVYFSGPQAVAAHGGPVPLYTPDPWQPGQSLVTLAPTSGGERPLMSPQVGKGPAPRDLNPVETGILKDLGYNVVPN
jgi:hypothetical protein